MQTRCRAEAEGQFVRLTGRGGVVVTMHVAQGGQPRVEGKWVRFSAPAGNNLVAFKFGRGAPPLPEGTFNPNGPGGVFGSWTLASLIENPFPGGSISVPPATWASAGGSSLPFTTPAKEPEPLPAEEAAPSSWLESNREVLDGPRRLMQAHDFAGALEAYQRILDEITDEEAAGQLAPILETARIAAGLQQAVIRGVKDGKRLKVSVELMGMRTRADVKEASLEQLSADALGQPVIVQWSELSETAFFRMASKCVAEEPAALMNLLRFAVSTGLYEEAEETAGRIRDVDQALYAEARALLKR